LTTRKLHISLDKINQIGLVHLKFSEKVWLIEELGPFNKKMFHDNKLIEVSYETQFEGENKPELLKWEVVEFTSRGM